MSPTFFDLESAPLPADKLVAAMPTFEAPGNFKDPIKIAANIEEQRKTWLERAALDATTGQVLCVGFLTSNGFSFIGDGESEFYVLNEFWNICGMSLGSEGMSGFNIFSFDLPFLIRRSWILGIKPPSQLRKGRYWHPDFTDIMELWTCGNREQRISLDTLAKSLGVGAKNGSGADFAALWASDRPKAIEYLRNDLTLTKLCYERLA